MTSGAQTIGGVLKAAADYLAARRVEQPRLAVELLAARLLNCRRLDLHLRADSRFSDQQLAAMRRGVKRVAAGEPVQYVVGETEFMGHNLKVDRRALIPRPETETLVEQVLACGDLWGTDPTGRSPTQSSPAHPLIVDLGTGCGCIAISLALAHPEAFYVGLDVSPEAVALARENAARHGLKQKIAFAAAEIADAIDPEVAGAIVANLPYVPTVRFDSLPVQIREYEPRVALDGGPEGVSIIEGAVQDAQFALRPGGHLFLEIGEEQGDAVTAMLRNAGFERIRLDRDLAGRTRVIAGRKP